LKIPVRKILPATQSFCRNWRRKYWCEITTITSQTEDMTFHGGLKI